MAPHGRPGVLPSAVHALLCLGLCLLLPLTPVRAHPPPVPAPAEAWLAHYQQLAAAQPAQCPAAQIPTPPKDMPSRAFGFPALAATSRAEPGIIYSKDALLEHLLVLSRDADGCVHAATSGRLLPFNSRAVASPFANLRIPAELGDTPPVAIVSDAKSIRSWIRYQPESELRARAALHWTLLGGYTGMLAVLLIVGLGFVAWRRNAFALAYVIYLAALLLYHLQALGVGPAWLPFWPAPEHARLVQAVAIALLVPSIVGVVLAFLVPRRPLALMIAGGTALAMAAFVASAWTDWGYRAGALIFAALTVLVLLLLWRRLHHPDPALRWFAAGLAASIIGGGLQATSAVAVDANLPAALSVAFPVGNLVEALCWLVALTLQFRSEYQRDRQRLWSAAHQDPLTNLYNRQWLRQRIAAALATAARRPGARCQLLLLDLDCFNRVNQRCGHAGGDAVLRQVGQSLLELLEPGEAAGRFSGDEFLLLLRPGRDPCAAEGRAGSILTKLAEPLRCGARMVSLRASIGIVTLHAGYAQVDDAIADATLAQEAARRQGGHRAVRFAKSMRRTHKEQARLRDELAQALERNQFLLHYQPVVDLDTGRAIGFEALLRWQHPNRGLLPAAQFVPVAATGGLIRALGYQVVQLACAQLQDWQQRCGWYGGEYLSINLSAEQLGDEQLLTEIRAALDSNGLDPSALRLEIPEAALASETPEVRAWRARVLGQHLLLCIDGFGAGQTPLDALADLAFDSIKLDATMAPGVLHQGRAQSLVQAGVALGTQFSCLVVAKGIESSEQLQCFRRLGCSYGQGDYLAAAMPAAAVSDWAALLQTGAPADAMGYSGFRLH
ncbi:putative bifunctional diguanylate cyclase/phosphodiesterase [Thiohalocapsa halophila]|nr:EAL domain-containing protein [Thiohalocapsa halophila]